MKLRTLLYASVLALVGALFYLTYTPATQAAPPKPSPIPASAAGDAGSLQIIGDKGQVVGLCPLQHTDVNAEISGFLARVDVTQTYVNPSDQRIEAVYVFPLPDDAAVNSMTMHIGDRVVKGVIKKREDARQIYDQAKQTGHVAALLDQERPNIFTQSVANILPGETVTIEITYVNPLKYEAGSYEFLFPTVVGPRYMPGTPTGAQGGGWSPDTTKVPDASRISPPVVPDGMRAGHDIAINVTVDAGVPIQDIRSELHQVDVERTGASSAVVKLQDKDTIPNKDFILRYDVAGAKVEDALLTHAEPPQSASLGGGIATNATNGYFTFILQPPDKVYDEDATPREMVFVLDTSGSMYGFPIEKAKEAMALALAHLRANDTFNLITFSGDEHILFPEPVPATAENLLTAQKFLASREGSGGTEMMKAIRAALAPSDKSDHLRIAVFMTDGYVGNDEQIVAEVQKHANARVFAFGIGNAVNRFLLDNMAKEGRGEVEYLTLNGDAEAAINRLDERVHTPLLTDVSIDWGGLPVTEVSPQRPADLFSAKPLVITGRYTQAAHGTITLRGRRAGQPFERRIAVDLPAAQSSNRVLATLWARRKIDSLMAQDWNGAQQGALKPELQAQVTQLGLDYALMTQFTSFVAVEEKVVTDDGAPHTVQVPVDIPEGVDRDMAVGDGGGVVGAQQITNLPTVNRNAYSAAAPAPPITGASQTVEVVGEGGVAVETQTSEISRTVGPGQTDPAAAQILGSMTNHSQGDAEQQLRRAPSSGGYSAPKLSKEEKDKLEAQNREMTRLYQLRQTYESKMTAEMMTIFNCVLGKTAEQAPACLNPVTATLQLRVALTDASPAVIAELQRLGFKVTATSGRVVEGELPIANLKGLADMKQVFFVSRAEPKNANR